MSKHTVIAVFASETQAIQARAVLVCNGVLNAVISTDLTKDGIAAEAPGQAYVDPMARSAGGLRRFIESGFSSDLDSDTADARLLAAIQRGSFVLSVGPLRAKDVERITALLESHSAVTILHC